MNNVEWLCKKNELEFHVKTLFEHYGEPLDTFDEYVSNLLKNDINSALNCMRNLINQLKGRKNGQQRTLPVLEKKAKGRLSRTKS